MSNLESDQEFLALEAEVMAEDFDSEEQGDPIPERNSEFMGSDQCAALCSTVFAVAASRKGEKWALKPDEAKALGKAIDPVLAKYLPSVGELGPEVALLGAFAAIILPRLLEDAQQAAQPEQAEGKGADVGDS